MSLREQLQTIYDTNGQLTPALVVETARPKNHPLHDTVFHVGAPEAAQRYYLQRAQDLIVSVKIRYRDAKGKPAEVRAWHAIRSDGPGSEYDYKPAEEIANDELQSAMLLRDMQRDWQQLKARWSGFSEFVAMIRRDLGEATG